MTRRGAYSHQSEIPASDNRIEEPGLTERAVQFRRFVDERMAAQGIASLVELADISDVGRDTLYAWFRGRMPTPRAGGRVARSLGVSYRELLDAFEPKGIEKGEAPSDLASLVGVLTDLVAEMRRIFDARDAERLARLRAVEADVRLLLIERGVQGSLTRSLPPESEE